MGRPTGPHIIAAVLLLIACATPGCSGPDEILRSGEKTDTTEGRVIRVVDGDTAIIRVAGTDHRVRFIGVDAPESTREVEPLGEEASAYAKRELNGRRVWLETDAELRDRYDRLLAYVWLAPPESRSDSEIRETQFNARLLLEGYASVSTFPPNVRYVDEYTRYAREAREAGRGLWSRSR